MLWALFFGFAFVILNIPKIEPIWEFFSDCRDYKVQSRHDLFSMDFYAPFSSPIFAARPFTVPLFYRMVGTDEYRIVIMQKVVYCLCSLLFVRSLLGFIKSSLVRIILAASLFFFFTWWNIVGWSDNLLSESLSMSMMFLWFAAILFFIRKQSLSSLVILAIVGFFFSFTRDTWPYIILFTYLVLFAFFYRRERIMRLRLLGLCLFAVGTFFFQQYTADVGERYKLPVFNSIAERISKNQEYLDWFRQRGMPQADQLVKDFGSMHIDTRPGQAFIYKRYEDSTYTDLFNWVVKDGKSVYTTFVITHPAYFFMMDQSAQERARIFSVGDTKYTLREAGFYANAGNVFPLFNSWLILGLLLVLVLIYRQWNPSLHLLFPALICLACIVNVYLSYNADALEVERHLFITQIILEVIGIVSVCSILDAMILRFSKRPPSPLNPA